MIVSYFLIALFVIYVLADAVRAHKTRVDMERTTARLISLTNNIDHMASLVGQDQYQYHLGKAKLDAATKDIEQLIASQLHGGVLGGLFGNDARSHLLIEDLTEYAEGLWYFIQYSNPNLQDEQEHSLHNYHIAQMAYFEYRMERDLGSRSLLVKVFRGEGAGRHLKYSFMAR